MHGEKERGEEIGLEEARWEERDTREGERHKQDLTHVCVKTLIRSNQAGFIRKQYGLRFW